MFHGFLTQALAQGCCPGGSGCLDALAGPSQTWPAPSEQLHFNALPPNYNLCQDSSWRACSTPYLLHNPRVLLVGVELHPRRHNMPPQHLHTEVTLRQPLRCTLL